MGCTPRRKTVTACDHERAEAVRKQSGITPFAIGQPR